MVVRPFPDPSILLHPQIPKPLHLMSPRDILGPEWWDKTRKEAYGRYYPYCHACCVDKYEAKYHYWLEGHEMYDIDYTTGRVEFVDVAALCHSCHSFIHQGRLRMLTGIGKISQEQYHSILAHGRKVLAEAGLLSKVPKYVKEGTGHTAKWEDYHMVIHGVRYEQRFKGYEEWRSYWEKHNKEKQ